MHLCAAECTADTVSSMNSVHQCVEHCARDLNRGQNYVQNELSQFQERLQRGVMMCQDKVKEKVSANPTEAEMKRHRSDFESCAVDVVNHHINQLPSLMEKIKKGLSQ